MGARGAAVTALVVALVLCASWAAVALLAVVAHRREAHARAAAEAVTTWPRPNLDIGNLLPRPKDSPR